MDTDNNPHFKIAKIEIKYRHSSLQMGTVFMLLLFSITVNQHYMIVSLITLLLLISAHLPWQHRKEKAMLQQAYPIFKNPKMTQEAMKNYVNDKQLLDLEQQLTWRTLFYLVSTLGIGFLMYSPK